MSSAKVKRVKRASRILTFFKYNYKFEPPFRVLVDGTFCMAALQNKINLKEQMPKYLQGEIEIVTTKCVIDELEQIGVPVAGALSICRHLTIDVCPHQPCKPAADCIVHLARRAVTKTKYIFGTQDGTLTDTLRKVVGTPIVYIKYNSILLDQISEKTKSMSERSESEIVRVKELKKRILGEEPQKKKKKKIKGKNPLSCKKKIVKSKPEMVPSAGTKTANGKRRRKKKTDGELVSSVTSTAAGQ